MMLNMNKLIMFVALISIGCIGQSGPSGEKGDVGERGPSGAPGSRGSNGKDGVSTHTPAPVWVDSHGETVAAWVGERIYLDHGGNQWTIIPDEGRITVTGVVDSTLSEFVDCSGQQWVKSAGAGVVVKWISGDFLRVQSKTTKSVRIVPYSRRSIVTGVCSVITEQAEQTVVSVEAFTEVGWPTLDWSPPLHLELR